MRDKIFVMAIKNIHVYQYKIFFKQANLHFLETHQFFTESNRLFNLNESNLYSSKYMLLAHNKYCHSYHNSTEINLESAPE